MKCSIVIPTLGRESLGHVLEALEHQTEPPLEVIVANDGDCDDLTDSAERETILVRNIRTGPRRGAAAARNAALDECRGDIVLFLDDDVVADANLIAAHLDVHRHCANAVALGLRRRVPYPVWTTAPLRDWGDLSSSDGRIGALEGRDWLARWWAFFQTCNASVPAVSVREAGGFDERFQGWGFEDTDLGYRLHAKGMSVHAVTTSIPLHLDAEESARNRFERTQAYLRNASAFIQKWSDDPALRLLVHWDIWRCHIQTEDDPHAA